MKSPRRHIVIPDCQVKEGVPLDHLTWAGKYIADKQPDVVINIGDFADMPSLSSYDKGKRGYEGRRYKKDVEAARKGMELLGKCFSKAPRWKPRLILTLGNHEARIERSTEVDPYLEGAISIDDLRYKESGWQVSPFLEAVEVDGVFYNHYFTTGLMDRPCSSARVMVANYGASCVAGHKQGRDVAYARKGPIRSITGIIAGSFYQHDEAYMSPLGNNHWRGIVVLNEVQDGRFDEMWVSLEYLKRKFQKGGRKYGR